MVTFINYIKESFVEIKDHVTYPPKSEVQKLTVTVALFSILFSLAVWGVDTAFSRVVGFYFGWING